VCCVDVVKAVVVAGIGKVTALELARRRARVILACRNVDSANETKGDNTEAGFY